MRVRGQMAWTRPMSCLSFVTKITYVLSGPGPLLTDPTEAPARMYLFYGHTTSPFLFEPLTSGGGTGIGVGLWNIVLNTRH